MKITALMSASAKGHKEIAKLLIDSGANIDLQNKDGITALMSASINGHKEMAKVLIDSGANIDLQNKDGITALMSASINGHKEMAKVLIDSGANIDLQNKDGITALIFASAKGHKEMAKVLIDSGANIDLQSKNGETALIFASAKGHKEIAKLLIDSGANIDLQNKNGVTALIFASAKGHKEMAKVLIDSGANIDLQNKNGVTALMSASINDHKEMAKVLIDSGANIDLQNKDGITALILISINGHKEMAKVLIDSGANIDLQDKDGITALMLISINGHKEMAKVLIDSGANIDLQNKNGVTALMSASINGHKEMAKVLIDSGANIDLQDKDGVTALIFASAKGHKEITKLLIDSGANIDLQDKDGITALMSASIKGHKEITKLLIDSGANIDLQNKNGVTALMSASAEGHKEIAKLLIDSGANIEVKRNNAFNILFGLRVSFIKNKILRFTLNVLLSIFDPIKGKTALMLASENGHKSVVKLLVENGANVEYLKYKEKQESKSSPIEEKIAYGIFHVLKLIFLKTPIYNYISKEDILEYSYKKNEVQLDNFILYYKYLMDEKQTMNNPQKLVNILNLFTKDNPIKYTTHSFEWSRYGSYQNFIDEVKREFKKIEDELKILSPNLYTKIYKFLFDSNLKESGGWGVNRIAFGWSSLELKEWSEIEEKKSNPKKAIYFPLPEEYQYEIDEKRLTTFGDICNIFKDEIEIRDNDKLFSIFSEIEEDILGFDFDVEYINLENISFYTDVEYFKSGIIKIFEQFKDREEFNTIEIEANRYSDYIEIVITQIDSQVSKTSLEMESEIRDGDFYDIQKYFKSLCDWSIEAKFQDGNFRIEYLSSKSIYSKREEIEKEPKGFKHILRFYK